MTRTILVTRPEPGLSATIEAAQNMGLKAEGYPLFEIRPVDWECPDVETIDALLIGSANAIRHGGANLRALLGKPVYAVGETTAETARYSGFEVAATGSGGLQNVLDAIKAPMRLLRISGREHVELSAPKGIQVHTRIAYEAVPCELPDDVALLKDGLTVLLHSAAAARQFDIESKRLDLDRAQIELAVIGPRVEAEVGTGWSAVHVSPKPNDSALLEMVREMCI